MLDVRRASEFVQGHITGATNIAHTNLASRLDEVPAGATLLINCRSGVRSCRASAYLARLGCDVVNLSGGYIAWAQYSPALPSTVSTT